MVQKVAQFTANGVSAFVNKGGERDCMYGVQVSELWSERAVCVCVCVCVGWYVCKLIEVG